jgi:ABC-type polysaccharide transport system permease subunit
MGLRPVEQIDSANTREFFRNCIMFRNLWPLEPGFTKIVYYLSLDFRYAREIAKIDCYLRHFSMSVCPSL